MPSPKRCRSQIPAGSAGWCTSRASHPTPSGDAGGRPCCRVVDCGSIRPRSHARASTCRLAHHTSRRSVYRVCLTKRVPSCSLDPNRGRRPRWRQRASRGLEGSSRLGRRPRRRGGAGDGHRIGRHDCSIGSSSSSPRLSARCRCWTARSGRGHGGLGDEPIAASTRALRPFSTTFGPQRSVSSLAFNKGTPGQSRGRKATGPRLFRDARSPRRHGGSHDRRATAWVARRFCITGASDARGTAHHHLAGRTGPL